MAKQILYEWRCHSCNTKYDALATSDTLVGKCPECGHESKRLISAPRLDPKMGLDPDNPTMYDKWARTRTQKAKLDAKRRESHGE